MKILLAPTAELGRQVIEQIKPEITVEAEYGGFVAEGTLYTAAHHQATGPYAGSTRPSPCNDPAIPLLPEAGTILVSHLDLDTIGGCARALGKLRLELSEFWRAAEFADFNPPHRLPEMPGLQKQTLDQLSAWNAWSGSRPRLDRTKIHDVTDEVMLSISTIDKIAAGDSTLLHLGQELKKEEEILKENSFAGYEDGVLLRRTTGAFVNHLYEHENSIAPAIVSFNETAGSITISYSSPEGLKSARSVVQDLWGKEAGGHQGIGGSPRGQRMTEEDFRSAVQAVKSVLAKKPDSLPSAQALIALNPVRRISR